MAPPSFETSASTPPTESAGGSGRSLKIPAHLLFHAVVACGLLLPLALPAAQRDIVVLAEVAAVLALSTVSVAWAWGILLFAQPILPMYPVLFGQTKVTVGRLLVVLLAFALATSRWTDVVRMCRKSRVFQAGLAFGVVNVICAAVTRAPESALRSLTYFEPVLFFGITWCLVVARPRHLATFVRIACASGVLVLMLGTVEFITQQSLRDMLNLPGPLQPTSFMSSDRFGLGGRVSSTLGQPVYAAIYFCLWLAVSWAWAGRRGRISVPAGLALAWGSLLLLTTASRGPILVAVVVLGTWLIRGRAMVVRASAALAAAALAFLLVQGATPRVVDHLQAAFSFDSGLEEAANVIGRADLTKQMLAVFRSHPVFGNGPGRIQQAALAGDAQFSGLAGLENTYAVLAADTGLLGLAAYLLFVMVAISAAIATSRGHPRAELRRLGAGMAWFLVFQSIVAISVFCPTGLNANVSMALLGGLLGAASRTGGGGSCPGQHSGARLP